MSKHNNSFAQLLQQVSKIAKQDIEEGQSESSTTGTQQQGIPNYQSEECSLEREQLREIHERCEDVKVNRELRKEYASKVYIFMCVWCGLVFLIIILDALTYTPADSCSKDLSFRVSNTVMTTLIGGTTVAVIGLVGFIIKGLFPNPNNDEKKHK